MSVKQIARTLIEEALARFGGVWGKAVVRDISHARDGWTENLPYGSLPRNVRDSVEDNNVPLTDVL
jgi:hypothetical protein